MAEGARSVYEFLSCRGSIRVDYLADEAGTAYALEINTIPGLQERSNLPVSCEYAGISYAELLTGLLAQALADARPAPWEVS
ncbi:hypothetical protein [Streptomyces sp. NBC_01443]|uniref:hypothetical protein n=1 Tax=Streptomyces sp. NBC_01443 TaxID=2903868 RepID=UPI00225B2837|nr:hypothetical protein [Streptomyces sp. NBC_01443]MCX4632351.1 hypothetical protein [Streptomyces sp. NBC_01443]